MPETIKIRNKATGEIVTLQKKQSPAMSSALQNIIKFLPEAGQVAGGFAGGALGAGVGRPYLGGGMGGTLGRVGGQYLQQQAQKSPIPTALRLGAMATGLYPTIQTPATFPPPTIDESGELAKTLGVAGITETLAGGAARGITGAGRGIIKGVLGRRLAERGIQRGWKNLLKPEFYKNKVPQDILGKVKTFFPKLQKAAGGEITSLINTKYKDVSVPLVDIKTKITGLLPEGVTFETITDSRAQQKLLSDLTKKVTSLGGKTRKLSNVWELRKNIDDIIDAHSWQDNSFTYLTKLRSILNDSIKSAGDDIGKAFTKYSSVMEAKSHFGKNFRVSKSPDGTYVSPEVESFARNIIKSSKDEQIRWLQQLDELLGADDKVIKRFLDYAGAEALEGDTGFSWIQKILLGALGGRKIPAHIGRLIQSLPVQAGARITGRAIPTAVTSGITRQ